MALSIAFWRILRLIHPCFLALFVFAATCFILQYNFYGEWLLRYPLFFLIMAFLVLVTYNRFGQDFGLSHLFWHEKRWIQFRMGFYISLLLALQWGISYEVLRDFDGNNRFKDMGIFRDRALLIPTFFWEHTFSRRSSEGNADQIENIDSREAANLKGMSRWWPIDADEAVASSNEPDQARLIANRYSLFYALTYLPSIALLAMAIFSPLAPRRPIFGKRKSQDIIVGVRGAGNGLWFVSGMVSAAALAYLLIKPCSAGYAWLLQQSRLELAASFFELSSVSFAGVNVPLYLVIFSLAVVALIINHKNTGRNAPKLDHAILGLLAVSTLFLIVQLRVVFPDPSAGRGEAARIVGWRAVEMVLDIFVITAIISMVFFTMKFAHQNSASKDIVSVTSQGSICIMLAFVSVIYGSFVQISWLADVEGMPIVQMLVCFPLVSFLVLRNSDRFKLRFPGMADYYEQSSSGANAVDLRDHYKRAVKGDDCMFKSQTPLYENVEVLENWRKLVRGDADSGSVKPKLAIVAVSGGSIRSGVWTAKVLTELERRIPGFPYHVRLITGASGGMIGASLYAADLEAPPPGAVEQPRARGRLDEIVRRLNYDCLNHVACQLALGDLPAIFSGRPQHADRGRALEQAWERLSGGLLGKPFDTLAEGELEGWRPSLVFSPMLAEDGRRLLVSNLDLEFLTCSKGPCLLDLPSRQLGKMKQRHPKRDLYSLSAFQFFRLFPKARSTFKLSTAIRMSASFPYVSPAVNLPTTPPRRVVDAGYYDNFGVNVAMSWVAEHRQWLLENSSGIVLVQVRAFGGPRDLDSVERKQDSLKPPPPRSSREWKSSIHWLTTPLKAVLQARSAGMSFRNDEQIAMLAEWFQEQGQEPKGSEFFQTVCFDCNATASLNWYITQSEFDAIVGCLAPDAENENWKRLEAMQTWWHHGKCNGPSMPGVLDLAHSSTTDERDPVSAVEGDGSCSGADASGSALQQSSREAAS